MQIPKALEQMVAGLISDERAEKERVEAVLSQIHELTKGFYDPDAPRVFVPEDGSPPHVLSEPQPAQPISQERLLENAIRFNMRRGDDKSTAEHKAKQQFGIED